MKTPVILHFLYIRNVEKGLIMRRFASELILMLVLPRPAISEQWI